MWPDGYHEWSGKGSPGNCNTAYCALRAAFYLKPAVGMYTWHIDTTVAPVVINLNAPTVTPTATVSPTLTPTSTAMPSAIPTNTPASSWHLGNFRPDAYGVRAVISAPNQSPSLQDSGESNWVSLPMPYWVQSGWRYYKGWIWAWSYVESFGPTTGYEIIEYSIHDWGNTIEYKVEWAGGTTWCGWINGVNKACYPTQSAPITVSARSEVHVSSQNELDTYFWNVFYKDSNGIWYLFDQGLWQENPPYILDKDQYYQFHIYGP